MAACISPIKLRRTGITVPCGKCNFCLQSQRADWTFRLNQELINCETAWFITITYDDEHLPTVAGADEFGEYIGDIPTLRKEHVQKFMKRLRKAHQLPHVPIRYYTVGEYGTKTQRPHYHSIMFNLPFEAISLANVEGKTNLELIWGNGSVRVDPCNGATIHYVTKYHLNKHLDMQKLNGAQERPFLLSRIAVAGSA